MVLVLLTINFLMYKTKRITLLLNILSYRTGFFEAQPLNTRRCLSVCLSACLSVLQLAYKDDIHCALYDLVVLVPYKVYLISSNFYFSDYN